jgi:hypothetical protein
VAEAGEGFCSGCGQLTAPQDAFCRSCGNRLADSEASRGRPEARPGVGERIGRGVGSSGGYAVRTFAGVATEPVVDTVWKHRPNIPTWQKVLGTIAWPVMLLTPHGWVFLGASFFVMVILGDHTPYSWAAWVTKWGSIFLAVTAALIVVAVIVVLSLHHEESTAVVLPLIGRW